MSVPGLQSTAAEPPPTLVCLIGRPAVGKMTVGDALCRLTGFQHFHGYVVAQVLSPFFAFGTPSFARLTQAWRCLFFEEAFRAGLSVVTTVAWRFDAPEDAQTIERWLQPYRDGGGRVLCVELAAPLAVRQVRNNAAERQQRKQQEWVTDAYLQASAQAHRYDSSGDAAFPLDVPHLRLETTDLAADRAAARIVEHFQLPTIAPVTPLGQL